jgi:hypothetical protein
LISLIGPSTRNGPFGRTVMVTSPSAMSTPVQKV